MTEKKLEEWDRYYNNLKSYLFPNEYVTRSFLGKYPNLDLGRDYEGKKICDVSCGDGRNMVLLHSLGFDLYGTEISDNVARITTEKLASHPFKIQATIKHGTNDNLPYEDDLFDYLLSWNAIYYMKDESASIAEHIKEYARILRPGGHLVCSVPSANCYSLHDSEDIGDHKCRLNPRINSWGNGLLKDTIFYKFESFDHIEEIFGSEFEDFRWCKISDDCYGLALDYFVFVCQKKIK